MNPEPAVRTRTQIGEHRRTQNPENRQNQNSENHQNQNQNPTPDPRTSNPEP